MHGWHGAPPSINVYIRKRSWKTTDILVVGPGQSWSFFSPAGSKVKTDSRFRLDTHSASAWTQTDRGGGGNWSNQEDREGGKYIHIYFRDSGHLMNYVEIAKSTYLFHVNEFQSLMQFVIFWHFSIVPSNSTHVFVYVVIWHCLSVDCLHK